MQRITLPNSSLSFSRLIYGVWRLADDSDQSTAHVRAKIDAAFAEGITTFDHADIYGNYACEQLFGQALAADKGLRERMEIVTKCDIAMLSDKFPQRQVHHYDTSAKHLQFSVEQSLKNLSTDYIDTLLIHRPDPFMDAAETGAALDALIDSGKIRSAGISNFHPEDWRLLQQHMKHKLVVNQIELNPMHLESFTNGDLSALQRDNIATMAWSPLAGGRLFGQDADAQRVRPILERIAEQNNSRVDLVALAWLMAHPANILPVVGTNNLQRIAGLAGALNIRFTRETWFEIYTAGKGQPLP